MQSGFGVNFLFWSGEFEENCRRISQRILMANFDSEFFGLVFAGFQATQKIHAQNSRPLQFHFLEPRVYSRRFSARGGDQEKGKIDEHWLAMALGDFPQKVGQNRSNKETG